jgi:hypothetical protein
VPRRFQKIRRVRNGGLPYTLAWNARSPGSCLWGRGRNAHESVLLHLSARSHAVFHFWAFLGGTPFFMRASPVDFLSSPRGFLCQFHPGAKGRDPGHSRRSAMGESEDWRRHRRQSWTMGWRKLGGCVRPADTNQFDDRRAFSKDASDGNGPKDTFPEDVLVVRVTSSPLPILHFWCFHEVIRSSLEENVLIRIAGDENSYANCGPTPPTTPVHRMHYPTQEGDLGNSPSRPFPNTVQLRMFNAEIPQQFGPF